MTRPRIDELLDRRPIVVALAGPNGAGKSTFFEAFLSDSGLRFLNADDLARELGLEPYTAAEVARKIRSELLRRRESFIFETVFSDPVGDKVEFLERAAAGGYSVVLLFVGLESAAVSDERVALRVSQGGHDVPPRKVASRFARSLRNLERAIERLPVVIVYDNSDLRRPYRRIATFRNGRPSGRTAKIPSWLRAILRAW